MNRYTYIIALSVGCAEPPQELTLSGADSAATTEAAAPALDDSEVAALPADRIPEVDAVAIASRGQTGFKATSTLQGPAALPNGTTPMVYAVTLRSDDGEVVRLRYVDMVTGELYTEIDETHRLDELNIEAQGDQAWYRSCPGGWICIRNPPSNIVFYSQRDPSWSSVRLGNSNLTIGSDGCLLTAYAMALREEGFGTRNPRDLNTLGVQRGCFSGPLVINSCLISAAGGRYGTIPVNNLWSTIASGRPVVAFGTSDCLGPRTHAQMIWGHDGARFWTKDPWFDYTQQDQSQCLSGISYRTIN
jgi:hypothetical protein